MKLVKLVLAAVLPALALVAAPAQADDLRGAMEADNAHWQAAFNQPDTAAFLGLYTADAMLLAPGNPPVRGAAAIREFWDGRIQAGVRDVQHRIVSVTQDGGQAHQVATWTGTLVKDGGERLPLSGNAVRVYERQADGRWMTKVHIFNRHQ